MKNPNLILISFLALLMTACIKDDFVDDKVDPLLRIISAIDTIEINTTYQFESKYLNNVGNEEDVDVIWSSSDPSIIEISANGLAFAKTEGQAIISVSLGNDTSSLMDSAEVNVGDNTIKIKQFSMGTIRTTSSYKLEGDFELKEQENGLNLSFADNYSASTALPGLFVYFSNNKNSIANAFEIGSVEVFNGAHSYELVGVGFSDYKYIVYFCKPFNVKVGDGEL